MHLPPAVLALGTIVSLPLLLIGGYVWQAGLDLHSPSSVRGWIELCARGREDVFCKAAQRVVRDVQGPVVLIYPGVTGDHDLLASLTRWKGRVPTAGELEALVRANLFEAAALQTGQMRSLDGQLRQVTCDLPDQRRGCSLDGLRVVRRAEPWNDGALYLPAAQENRLDFLAPLSSLSPVPLRNGGG
ncbi:hypothetical protein CBQ26_19480 [Deinococcus indicus]|uniref:Uncharacterized protein n=1 Tax=Deinococcus indicus TaxID=223556 RepID=A0A246BF84_9DEIO|nr:hypothetical protein [Deinococcus indicus]OWL93545.1 hypothetical protein CBQ26_19480 [Deinococcus indicus]GHG31650.1 hypothetical protein GCM10017784_26270 [Deinococcus indicus]